MPRMKPAWYYTKQATEAQARATYYQNRTPPTNTTVNSRGPSVSAYYRSLLMVQGTDHLIIKVPVLQATVALVSLVDAGLKSTLASGETAISRRMLRLQPSTIRWYEGDPSPVAKTTAWNTRYIKYSKAGRGVYKSIPVSKATGTIDADDIQLVFDGLFGPSGTKLGLLGTSNGRAWLDFEKMSITANS